MLIILLGCQLKSKRMDNFSFIFFLTGFIFFALGISFFLIAEKGRRKKKKAFNKTTQKANPVELRLVKNFY
jgi:hypothetical protein